MATSVDEIDTSIKTRHHFKHQHFKRNSADFSESAAIVGFTLWDEINLCNSFGLTLTNKL